jgi:hypothetical protein
MSAKSRTWIYAASVLGILVIILLSTTLYYYYQYTDISSKYNELIKSKPVYIHVSLLIDFGNGTKRWYNGTTPAGSTFLDYLIQVTNGQVEWVDYSNPARPTYTGAQGPADKSMAFVISILGVKNTKDHYWLFYYYSTFEKNWVMLPVGAGQYVLGNNSMISCVYTTLS